MATLHGKNLHIYLGTGGVALAIGEARSFSISIDQETSEDNAAGDTWRTLLGGFKSWSLSAAMNFDTADAQAFTAASSATSAVNFYGYPDRSTTGRYYYGTAWVKMTADVDITGTARGTFTGEGSGAISEL